MGKREEIGLRIRTMRKSRNMTQEDLARAIEQSASSITMYETGRREPDLETLEALADVFNVTLGSIVTGDNYHGKPVTIPDSNKWRLIMEYMAQYNYEDYVHVIDAFRRTEAKMKEKGLL